MDEPIIIKATDVDTTLGNMKNWLTSYEVSQSLRFDVLAVGNS